MGMTENGSETSRERGRPHPEERGYSRGPAKLERACARLEGWGGGTPSCFETAASPPPQHEGVTVLSMRGITIARVVCPAKPELWFFPVLVLFRPVIDGQIGWPRRRRRRAFLVFILQLTGRPAAPGCARPPVFLLLFTGKNRRCGAAGVAFARCRCRSASLPLRGVGGARVRDLDGAVATFQKPGTGGRARASRLRAADGARPMQGRRPLVVEHARALHRRRRPRRHGGGVCARRLPASDQAGLRQ